MLFELGEAFDIALNAEVHTLDAWLKELSFLGLAGSYLTKAGSAASTTHRAFKHDPKAVANARVVRAALIAEGIQIRPLAR